MPLCTVCHQDLPREDFSKVQLTKKPAHQRKCKNCADISVSTHNVAGNVGDGPSSLILNTETDANKDRVTVSDTAATISSTSSSGQHPGDHLVEQQHPNLNPSATGIAKDDDDHGRLESTQDLVIVQDTSINNTVTVTGAGGTGEEEEEDVTTLRETIAQLKKELQGIRALPKQEHDDDGDNNKNAATVVTQPSGIPTDAMEVMERTKQRMSSLEELAADAVRSLLLVQAQTTAELESLRSSLLQVQEERDALQLQVVSLQQKQQQQKP